MATKNNRKITILNPCYRGSVPHWWRYVRPGSRASREAHGSFGNYILYPSPRRHARSKLSDFPRKGSRSIRDSCPHINAAAVCMYVYSQNPIPWSVAYSLARRRVVCGAAWTFYTAVYCLLIYLLKWERKTRNPVPKIQSFALDRNMPCGCFTVKTLAKVVGGVVSSSSFENCNETGGWVSLYFPCNDNPVDWIKKGMKGNLEIQSSLGLSWISYLFCVNQLDYYYKRALPHRFHQCTSSGDRHPFGTKNPPINTTLKKSSRESIPFW